MGKLALALASFALAAAPLAAEEGANGTPAEPSDIETAAPEIPAREPVTSISGAVPPETPQERMERFKRERGAGSDKPFEGFALQAEQEALRRREEAIGGESIDGEDERGADAQRDDLEAADSRARLREQVEDQIAKLGPGSWGPTTCFEEPPDWSQQDDLIRHRPLTREDFLSRRAESAHLAVRVSGTPVPAYLAVNFSCELSPKVTQLGEERFIAEITDVRFYSLLSRRRSWWNEDAALRSKVAYTLGHEQLHFDLAEAFMRWLNQRRDKILVNVRGSGKSQELALGKLQLEWAKLMLAINDDFDAIETAYDRQTKHGTVPKQQTFWSWRAKDGFPEVTKTLRLRVMKYLR